jgi:hypothetical protein
MELPKVKLIFDNSGAIYIASILSETPVFYMLHNPAQLLYQINEDTKEVEINIIPVCFPEVLSNESKEKGTNWTYQKSNAKFVSVDENIVDSRVLAYYTSIFKKQPNP